MHLPSVRVAEFSDFEIHYQKATQAAMKEDEVDTKPGVVDAKPALATEKGKVIAQLQEEIGEVLDERPLQV